ncbi:hydroxymethylbilane synthase [Sphingomonas astaxanthinifaciens]|uniref:Porphobilinogen deaminase n=1 Tax=Sphingomonas astaxanthinifaciens DSM 22298 TaxID=1123267 RepID=A0ABQ5Z5C2_9SPHN|nr:hydroxymethylbilane synthase [Sphingomonas astaxanthinifaciens]GLR46721.1 porphobilinogen deaminase [Sphingomonas astaxanthinifaciens DSM 22298]
MTAPLTLGTRASPLALAQAHATAAALEEAHGWDRGTVSIFEVRTTGDRVQDRALAEIGGKALWTKELDVALLGGATQLSVHSCKDVESERPPELVIAAFLPRADVRDRLIGSPSIEALAQGARVGTSSPRRTAQLLRQRPDLQVSIMRGNVATRLLKIAEGSYDATFLAAAGLDRLGIDEGCAVETDAFLPAPGQAAIAIECRADDGETRALLAAIDHRDTHRAVLAERALARGVGGSCHSPVAALAVIEGDGGLWLRAELLSSDGAQQVQGEIRAGEGDEEAAGLALAAELLDRAPPEVRMLFAAA